MTTLFANIYAEANIIQNETLYSQTEMEVAYLDMVRTFGIVNSRINLYAEEDESNGEKSSGFFGKIIGFIKTLINKIVEFVKKLARKTLEIITKPFGTKMKAANNSSGGGGSNNRTESKVTDTNTTGTVSTIVSGVSSNVAELNGLIKRTLHYLKTSNKIVPHAELKKALGNFDLVKDPINLDKIYKESDFNNLLDRFDDLSSTIEEQAEGLSDTYETKKRGNNSEFVDLLNKLNDGSKTLLIHPEGVVKIEYLKETNKRNQLIETLKVGKDIVKDSLAVLSTFAKDLDGLTDKNVQTKTQNAISKILATPASKRADSDCGDYKVFGFPANEAYAVRRLSLVAAGDKPVMELLAAEIKGYIGNTNANLGQFNIKTITGYSKMLSENVAFASNFKSSIFQTSPVSSGDKYKDLFDKKKFHIQYAGADDIETAKNIKSLEDIISDLSTIDKDYNAKDANTGKSGSDNYASKVDMEKLNSAKVVKDYVAIAGKIVRHLGNQTIPFLADVKYVHESLQANPIMRFIIVRANIILWCWDAINADLDVLNKALDNKAFTDRVFDGKADAIKNAKYKLNKIKEDVIKSVADSFGVKAQ